LNATLEAGERLTAEFGGGQLTAAERMAQFKAQVQNTKDQIGLALLPALNAVLEPIQNIASVAGPRLIEWAQRFGEILGENIPRVIGIVTDLLSGDFTDAIWDVATVISSVFGRDAAVSFLKFVDATKSAIESVVKGFTEEGLFIAIENLLDALGIELPPKFWDTLNAIMTAKDNIIAWLGTVVAWVQENWPIFKDTIIGAAQAVSDWFVANWPMIQAVILTVLEVIKIVAAWIGEKLPVAFAAVAAVWLGVLKPALEGLVSFVKDNLTVTLIALGSIIVIALVPAIIAAATAIGVAIAAFLAIAIPIAGLVAALIALGLLWQTYGEQVQTTVEQLGVIIEVVFAPILETATTQWEAIKTAISTAWDAIVTIATMRVADVLAAVVTGLVNVISAIRGKIEAFKTVGAALMEGLKAGIISKVQGIIDKVKDAVQRAIDAAKGLLGIDSPSKVFASIGQNMMEGMAIGISANQAMPVMATLGAVGATTNIAYNNTMNVNTRATTATVQQDFRTMAALAGA